MSMPGHEGADNAPGVEPPYKSGESPWGYKTCKQPIPRPPGVRSGEKQSSTKPRAYADIKSYRARVLHLARSSVASISPSKYCRMTNRPALAIVYEHPEWFKPLLATLDRRGVDYRAIRLQDHHFDLAAHDAPAPLIFSRVAMSSFLRQDEHPIFYAQSLYAHWEWSGARVINGTRALAVDASKARQLTVIQSLGLDIPATRVVHRQADIPAAAQGLRFPVIVKVNIGGSGAGVARYDTQAELEQAVANASTPISIDSVILVQEYVPARNRQMVRMETLNGKFLYAITLNTDGGTFDLCPADVCLIDKPTVTVREYQAEPDAIRAAEAIAQAAGLDIGGIEFMIDDRDGARRFYDINGLSNFVADPLGVLGWDPHETLVDYLVQAIGNTREKAA